MKILLINPPLSMYKKKLEASTNEPLGLAYLATFLRENRYSEVRILDALSGIEKIQQDGKFFRIGLSDEEIRNYLREYRPDIVGLTVMYTVHSKGAHDVAKLVKEVCPDSLVVFGGAHPSALPEWVLEDTNVDLVVKGEGEITFLEIVQNLEKGNNLKNISGTVVRNEKDIKFNEPRPLIKDLDSLPFPARDLLDMNLYLSEPYRMDFSMRPPRANLVSSRGCPYACIYCGIHSIWEHKWRYRSPKNVVDEIEFLVNNYGVGEIAFQDDNLSASKERMKEICKEIIRRKLKIRWCTPNGIALWTLDKELIDLMHESGCYKLTFGIETGSVNTQKFIRKIQIDLTKSVEIIKYCNRVGIWTHSAFILGFPYETREDIKATIDYSIKSDLDLATYFVATPYPGTPMFEVYQKEGLLPDFPNKTQLEWEATVEEATWDTKFLKREEIHKAVTFANRKFYIDRIVRFMNPVRILRKIKGIDELKFFLRFLLMFPGEMRKRMGLG